MGDFIKKKCKLICISNQMVGFYIDEARMLPCTQFIYGNVYCPENIYVLMYFTLRKGPRCAKIKFW